jgi:fatty-acyl-CoA synthase
MSTAHARGPQEPALLDQTIGANLRAVAQRHAGRDALVSRHQDARLTYAELDAEVDRVARALMAHGIAVGDRVGVWSPNCAEWTLLQFATARVGAVLVNLNPAYRTSELAYALRQSGTRLLFAPRSFKTSDYAGMVDAVAPEVPSLEHVVWIGDPAWDGFLAGSAQVTPEDLAAREAELDPGQPINIQYTSGTTGSPKGATLSHRNILNNGYLVGEGCRYTEEDRVCIPVPFYHCFGMVMGNLGAMTHGACMVIPAPAFDPGATLEAVAAERCTSLYGVPTMFIAELGHPEFASFDLSSLRTGIMAGSPCPVEVMGRVIEDMHMDEVTICYGMTETSPVSTQTAADDPLDKRVGTVGRVHPHLEVKVADTVTGETCAVGETGELCTRGYSVMLGYWDDLERTAEVLDADGWMHTGDLATMDAEGYANIRRPHQGHDHPRRRERLPARAGGVPLRPSRHRRRAGDRRARRALRRGADGLGDPAPGRRADARRRPRALPRQGGPLQDPALRQGRRRVPDDRDRQGPEVQDARDRHRRAGARAGGLRQDGLGASPAAGSAATGAGAGAVAVSASAACASSCVGWTLSWRSTCVSSMSSAAGLPLGATTAIPRPWRPRR